VAREVSSSSGVGVSPVDAATVGAGSGPGASPVVSVRDLRVTFVSRDRTVHAVNGVSFDLAAGEVLGILGEPGSGKSVTLRALMRLLPVGQTRIGSRVAPSSWLTRSSGQGECWGRDSRPRANLWTAHGRVR
jgi:ABC-type multidrug transport system fused ATPase/permease subunit